MINIMFAGNQKVFDGLLLASISILKYCKAPICVFVLTMDLTEENRDFQEISDRCIEVLDKLYKETNSKSIVKKTDVKDKYLEFLSDSPNKETFYTPYALLRLLADRIDKIPDKVLYLDADVLCKGDISELYNIDIEKYEIAGVKDYYGKIFFYPRYLNSGVLLLNMKKIRKTNLLSKALGLCSKKKIFLPDQTAINKYARKKLILPSRFNEQKKLKDNTLIRHFSMTLKFFPKFKKQNIKPWHIDNVHNVLNIYEFDDTFDRYNEIITKENLKGE